MLNCKLEYNHWQYQRLKLYSVVQMSSLISTFYVQLLEQQEIKISHTWENSLLPHFKFLVDYMGLNKGENLQLQNLLYFKARSRVASIQSYNILNTMLVTHPYDRALQRKKKGSFTGWIPNTMTLQYKRISNT